MGTGKLAQQLRPLTALAEDQGFISQHLHRGSQPYVTPARGAPTPSTSFTGIHDCAQMCTHTHTHRDDA